MSSAEEQAITPKIRRTWCYVQPPSHFEISPCACGNQDTQWSEYEGHLWCAVCDIDFVPKHSGVFSGPIPIRTAMLMGLCFDRYNLLTKKVEVFDPDNLTEAQS